ncbi:MAG: hypothetical protein ACSHX6_13190 [Akkermansiaceae bacterium]
MTEEILAELDFPDWYWGGAHVYENVERNFRVVDGELLDQYFGLFPASGVNDPQSLLDEEQRMRIEGLVAAHDMKSAMPLYVNVLAHGQNISLTEGDMREAILKMFKGKNALVIFYYYGYARGVKGYVLVEDQGFVENWEVDELFLKSARDASVQVADFAEIETFVTEFSKRSFWLEQELIAPVLAEPTDIKGDGNDKANSGSWDQWLVMLTDHTMTIVFALWTIAAGGWYYLWSRKWRKYVLPKGNLPVRLGADYGANVSSPIEFSNTHISLAEQYEKAKNKDL